ncbi:MAG TPA: SOS response-associated peptidase [Acidimicrobiia bacterium]|nr:SOS response-associated peptidase [Acidimicrobiia bacterium]
MCGRFATTGDIDFYAQYYGVDDVTTDSIDPSWNVAPTDESYVVAEHEERKLLGRMGWGLIPHWSKDNKSAHINARAETVATAPAFRRPFTRHRCLIPADGFYEWEPKDKGRTPHWVYRADGYPMSFAGIWSGWKDPKTEQWTRRFAIITTKAEGVIAPIHDRMPVVLPQESWEAWLDRDLTDPEMALDLLRPLDPDLIMEYAVGNEVNNVRNNGASLRQPLSPALSPTQWGKGSPRTK